MSVASQCALLSRHHIDTYQLHSFAEYENDILVRYQLGIFQKKNAEGDVEQRKASYNSGRGDDGHDLISNSFRQTHEL